MGTNEDPPVTPEGPPSLREISRELDPHHVSDDMVVGPDYIEDGSRIVKPDSDGITRISVLDEDDDKPRTTEKAAELLQRRRQDADEARYVEGEKFLDESDQRHREQIREAVTFDSEADRAYIENIQQHQHHLQQLEQRQGMDEARALVEVRRLNAAGMVSAAKLLAEQAVAGRQAVEQQRAVVARQSAEAQRYTVDRLRAAGQQRILRAVPSMQIEANRKDYKRWEEDQGTSLETIESTWDPDIIIPRMKMWQKERAAAHDKIKAREVGKHRLSAHGPGSARTEEAARDALRQSGTELDALNLMALRRAGRRY